MTTVLHNARGSSFERVVEQYTDVTFIPLSTYRTTGAHRAEPDVLFVCTPYPDDLEDLLARPVAWIHTMDTGVDGFPLELVGDRVLTCGRGANAAAIAEWVMAMILSDAKQLPAGWVSEPPERWYVGELRMAAGSTVALLGLGAIGQQIARRCLAFDMQVRALRRSSTDSPVTGVEMAIDINDLLVGADHVVIAAPLTPELVHVIDADALAAIDPGAHLINISRGRHVDQDALRLALDDGSLRLASLDVCDPEPLPADHWLYTHPRVRLSPHVSWYEPGATTRLYEAFGHNLQRYLDGRPLEGVVDPVRGY